jgi:hypothetical protein
MDVVLAGGSTIKVDMGRISIREYRELLATKDQVREDELLAQAAGLTVDELLDLPQPDYRLVVDAFFKTARAPLADPTSASAST